MYSKVTIDKMSKKVCPIGLNKILWNLNVLGPNVWHGGGSRT